MKNNYKKGFIVPAIIAIVVLLVLGAGYWVAKKNQMISLSLSQNSQTNQDTDWKTYRTEQNGYELKYPADWRVETDTGPSIRIINPLRKGKDETDQPTEFVWVIIDQQASLCKESDWEIGFGLVSYKTVCISGAEKIKVNMVAFDEQAKASEDKIVSTIKFLPGFGDSGTSTPVINSISPSSGPIGTTIALSGTNFAGFEGDKNAWIEDSTGKMGIIYGDAGSSDTLIKFKLAEKYCTKDTSYSGLPCDSYLNVTPGTYSIYMNPWGKMSNKVQFTVTSQTSSAANTSSGWKVYSNPEYGFKMKYPADGQISDVDIVGGRALFLSWAGSPLIEIDVQSKSYGNNGPSLVPAKCDDYNYYASNTLATFNGISFIKTDTSGNHGGMESAAVAQSYCVVHNEIRYRLEPRYQYARYTGGEKGDGPYTVNAPPDKAVSFQKFDQVIDSLDFQFTNNDQSNTSKNSQKYITVVSPSGGEPLKIGSTYQIKWTTSNIPVDKAGYIDVMKDGQAVAVISKSAALNGGSLSNFGGSIPWTVPSSLPAGNGYSILIGIGSYYDPDSNNDYLNNPGMSLPFTITSQSTPLNGTLQGHATLDCYTDNVTPPCTPLDMSTLGLLIRKPMWTVQADGSTAVTIQDMKFNANGSFSASLPPGIYYITEDNNDWSYTGWTAKYSGDISNGRIEIKAGSITKLDVTISKIKSSYPI